MVDVLIIGSGGAGLSAALSAKKNGAKVLVVSKTYATHSQTCQAQGGINAVLNSTKEDSVENFINDTYKASHKLGNKKTIKFMCENSEKTISWLDDIGVPFSRNQENHIYQRKFGGTKAQRTCYSSDYTGLKILHTLYDQCLKENIEFLNEHQLLNLLVKENSVQGINCLDINQGEIKRILAKKTIIASGGYAGIYYGFTTNSYASTGDGIAAAFEAGAKLSNMEFIQFHPTALKNKNILISESARGEGGYLVDNEGNRFVDELKPRDEVARAIYEKYEKNQEVFLDLRHLGLEKINETMPQERRLVKEFMNLEMENDLIPINPSAHYCMGGILVNENCEASLENLYACGEASQSSIHGANRLGGNSLLDIITFGKLAGEKASKASKNNNIAYESSEETKTEEYLQSLLKKENEVDFYTIKKELGKLFFKKVGLFREEKSLKEALEQVKEWKTQIPKMGIEDKSKIYNKNLCDFLEFTNMLNLSEIIIQSAINRKECRGAHYRIDFKEQLDSFDKNSNAILENDSLELKFEDRV